MAPSRSGHVAIGLALFLPGCGAAEQGTSHVLAEAAFVAPYAATRAQFCPGHGFRLTMSNRPNTIIETMPPIEESAWKLETCHDQMEFLLDCASREPGGFWCGAHDWPRPVGPAEGGLIAHEIEAVIEVGPRCSKETSCLWKEPVSCGEDGFTLRRYEGPGAEPDFIGYVTHYYEISRCGKTRDVSVRCRMTTDEAYRCSTTFRDVVP